MHPNSYLGRALNGYYADSPAAGDIASARAGYGADRFAGDRSSAGDDFGGGANRRLELGADGLQFVDEPPHYRHHHDHSPQGQQRQRALSPGPTVDSRFGRHGQGERSVTFDDDRQGSFGPQSPLGSSSGGGGGGGGNQQLLSYTYSTDNSRRSPPRRHHDSLAADHTPSGRSPARPGGRDIDASVLDRVRRKFKVAAYTYGGEHYPNLFRQLCGASPSLMSPNP